MFIQDLLYIRIQEVILVVSDEPVQEVCGILINPVLAVDDQSFKSFLASAAQHNVSSSDDLKQDDSECVHVQSRAVQGHTFLTPVFDGAVRLRAADLVLGLRVPSGH